MENKNYLDKVLDYIVSRTKIDYDKGEIIFPFTTRATPYPFLSSTSPLSRLTTASSSLSFLRSFPFSLPFVKYCNGQFGLTEEEIEYVWKEYVEIIEDKIEPIMITSHKGLSKVLGRVVSNGVENGQ